MAPNYCSVFHSTGISFNTVSKPKAWDGWVVGIRRGIFLIHIAGTWFINFFVIYLRSKLNWTLIFLFAISGNPTYGIIPI